MFRQKNGPRPRLPHPVGTGRSIVYRLLLGMTNCVSPKKRPLFPPPPAPSRQECVISGTSATVRHANCEVICVYIPLRLGDVAVLPASQLAEVRLFESPAKHDAHAFFCCRCLSFSVAERAIIVARGYVCDKDSDYIRAAPPLREC